MKITDQSILVVGMGKSGIAAATALLSKGAKVSVYDKKTTQEMEPNFVRFFQNQDVTFYLGTEPKDMMDFDLVVMSPGVPLTLPFLERAQEQGVKIIGEVELAYRLGQGTYVAITGTNGKTTTTVLTGELFKDAGKQTEVVGNVGLAVISKALSATPETYLITEVSSFQLETTSAFHPHISALLNITPDHMDRHHTMENYAKAKGLVFQNQTAEDYFVVNYDDEMSYRLAKECKATVVPFSRKEPLDFGAYVHDNMLVVKDGDGTIHTICGAEELGIPGAHNLENALAATAIAFFAGIEPSSIAKTLRRFQGVAHRLEYAGEVNGVRFVNDSKGTNPDASIKAIEAMKGDTVLIAGGYDKGSSFDEFIDAFGDTVKVLVLLGKTAPAIKAAAETKGFQRIIMAKDMEECVREGFKAAKPGDTVLLSPACASWDMYQNYEQRGEHFKNCVRGLEK